MTDAAGTTLDHTRGGGFTTFLTDAVGSLFAPSLRMPAALLLAILTFSNIVIVLNLPEEGGVPSYAFLAAAFVRVGGILVLGVAMLRLLADSERYPWRPDGAFWLYALSLIATFGVASVIMGLVGSAETLSGITQRNVLLTLVLSPFAPWLVAIAAATPLAWNPIPFLHDFRGWLPPLIVWTLVLVTPMGILHAVIDLHLVKGVGEWFWPLVLFDGPLSAVLALLALALNAEAYRRVARG